tara:strand:+ start:2806 stop:2967 length:162 start_codon:yes stop_codon:yes gene_type:complete
MIKKKKFPSGKINSCIIPRKQIAIEALLTLAWKKTKKERDYFLTNEAKKYYMH